MRSTSYTLVTGSVHADIGKGTVAALLARARAKRGERILYVKIDPCLQGPIDQMPSSAFGEVVRTVSGHSIDVDVARAQFLVPGFVATDAHQRSLGRSLSGALVAWHEAHAPAPRLLDGLASLVRFEDASSTIVEVGGSAGEPEHALVLDALRRHVGPPSLHVHVTGLLHALGGRPTSKPAQVALHALSLVPDVLLARGDRRALASLAGCIPVQTHVVSVDEDRHAPERAMAQALVEARLFDFDVDDEFPRGRTLDEVAIVGAESDESVASLLLRLRLWSRGRLRPRLGPVRANTIAVVALGKNAELTHGLPTFVLDNRACDCEQRPDWVGTYDEPEGALAAWVAERCATHEDVQRTPSSPYVVPEFAARYLAASEGGSLRDHAILDEHVRRAMGDVRGRHILDLGCGSGRWSERLTDEGASVVGVEPARPMLARARTRLSERVRFVEADAESYVPDAIFDGVLASMSLDHVESLLVVLERLHACLTPGGWLIVTTEHPLRTASRDGLRWTDEAEGRSARVRDYGAPGWRAFTWFDRPEVVSVFHRTFGQWVQLLRDAGFDLVEVCEPVSSDPRDGGNPRFWMLHAQTLAFDGS
ncbi:MAG: methyltransferase domain-containing protein [Myxococcales bacterium]|nr:methyltransferase domain-containing protein [Myxococcales bacterium]